MQAIVLAAGRGSRLKPITDTLAKPLVKVGQYALIEWHIRRLVSSGISDIVINVHYMAEQIIHYLGDGNRHHAHIQYSVEHNKVLKTGGGIKQALAFIQSDEFLVINGDIFTDFDFSTLSLTCGALANLVVVDNPDHNEKGDFILNQGMLSAIPVDTTKTCTFAGIGIYHRALFEPFKPEVLPLIEVIKPAMQKEQVTGQLFSGLWIDVGTYQRLMQARSLVSGLRSL